MKFYCVQSYFHHPLDDLPNEFEKANAAVIAAAFE
jgi:hypothetical protein